MSLSIPDFPTVLQFVGTGLLRASICGGIALALAWLVSLFPRLTTPSARCWIWRFALLQLFVAFFWVRPGVSVPVLPASAPTPLPAEQPVATNPANDYPWMRYAEMVMPQAEQPVAPPRAPQPKPALQWTPANLLVGLWGLAALAGLALLSVEWRRSLRLERQLSPVEDGALLSRCGVLARALELPYVPHVGAAREVETPTLLGLTRLTVALPPELLESTSEEDLELVLAHELAHIQRRDLYWTWLPVLARTLFFFHPLVWLAQREYHLAQEGACDLLAVEYTGTPLTRYGELLLRISTGLNEPNERLAAARMGESYSQLARRLKVIKSASPVTPSQRAASSLLVSGMALVGLTPWQLGARAANDPKGTAQAGPYTVRVAGVRPGGNSFSSFSSFGGGGSFGPGGFRKFENPPTQQEFRPNVSIELEVRAGDTRTLAELLGVAAGARGVDNQGRPVTSSPMAPMSFPVRRMADARTERIELIVPAGAKRLRLVEAALVMQPAEERVISFGVNALQPGASKRVGNVTVKIDSVQTTEQGGLSVSASYELPKDKTAAQSGPIGNIQQQMRAGQGVTVTLHDNDGQDFRPRTYAGGGGGGGGSYGGGFTFSNGTTAGTRRYNFGKQEGLDEPNRSSYNYTFAPLVGTRPETLEFKVLERVGEAKQYPFRLENLDLP